MRVYRHNVQRVMYIFLGLVALAAAVTIAWQAIAGDRYVLGGFVLIFGVICGYVFAQRFASVGVYEMDAGIEIRGWFSKTTLSWSEIRGFRFEWTRRPGAQPSGYVSHDGITTRLPGLWSAELIERLNQRLGSAQSNTS
jgi:hypothetical protein